MANVTSDATFKTDVLDADIPVLVDFWAPWCGPCRMMGPILDKLSGKIEGKARIFKLNVDESPQTAATYGITAIPTVLVFKAGEVQKQLVGVQADRAYEEALGL